MDCLYSMPPISAQATSMPAVALKKEVDQAAAAFGCGGAQSQRASGGVLPPPQLPLPEHFPPALQALAEQQRLFMERKYQEQVWPATLALAIRRAVQKDSRPMFVADQALGSAVMCGRSVRRALVVLESA